MSRSNLPQSVADRIAAAATMAAVAAIVWVILAVAPDSREVSFATAHAATARHVDEGNRVPTAPSLDYFPARFKGSEGAPSEPIATF
jgi:hypothetical protein